MYGVIALFDDASSRHVEDLWRRLHEVHALGAHYEQRFPHLSFHVAEAYEAERLSAALLPILGQLHPTVVRSTGRGLFTAPSLVLHLPVAAPRSLRLVQPHIWEAADACARAAVEHYHPDRWMPHVTLASGDLRFDDLPRAVSLLVDEMLEFEIRLERIAICQDDGRRQTLEWTFDLSD